MKKGRSLLIMLFQCFKLGNYKKRTFSKNYAWSLPGLNTYDYSLAICNSSCILSPLRLACSKETAQQFPVFSRSSRSRKYHGSRSNFNPTQPSAPNFCENSRNWPTSSSSKYFFWDLVILHSIATRRWEFPAKISGEGYCELPLPGARMQAQPASLKYLTSSLSPLV